jgi:ABC-2 type transport system permease protein
MRALANIFWLGTKELRSFFQDYVLLGLVIWSFSFAIYTQAQESSQELHNASVAIVDEDGSRLSRQLAAALLPPHFKRPEPVAERDVNRLMDTGRFTFVLMVPPNFERDVLGGRRPEIGVLVDATAMMQAGIGSSYIQQIFTTEIAKYLSRNEGEFLIRSQGIASSPVTLATRIAFNPNISTAWFTSIMGIISSVTMLAIILSGAAVVREREHGTMDHLLVMPVTPFEIAAAKIWANGLVITVAVGLSLTIVVRQILAIPVAGSVPLFMAGVVLYLFFATAIGIFLATIARTMPQLGLLYILVAVPLNLLSGANTPVESMPPALGTIMSASPTTLFVSYAQAILYRGAGLDVVWPRFVIVALIGAAFFTLALFRFRAMTAAQST